jgi:hypothetical protein
VKNLAKIRINLGPEGLREDQIQKKKPHLIAKRSAACLKLLPK